MVGVYKITSPSGRIYIGQSWNIERRFRWYNKCYKNRSEQPVLFNSFHKYGVDQHKFKIIHPLPNDVDQSVLDTYEILYFEQYRSGGADMMNVKEPGKGGKPSKETRLKMGLARKGRKHSEETKRKIGAGNKGNKSRTGMINSQSAREKVSKAQRGVRKNPESVKKMKETQRKRVSSLSGLIEDYKKREVTVVELGKRYNISATTLQKVIKENGIPFRSRGGDPSTRMFKPIS